MDRYQLENAKEKVSGYYNPSAYEVTTGKQVDAFDRAKAECLFNLKRQMENIEALTPEQFGIKQANNSFIKTTVLTGGAEEDPLYGDAVEAVREARRSSVSFIQRKLRIGYNRAVRIVDRMESEGVVTQMSPTGNREVLM